jgi:hypothetical protein
MRRKGTALLIIRVVVEVVCVVYRLLLLVLPLKVITPFFLQWLVVLMGIGIQDVARIRIWLRFQRSSCG